MSQDHLRRDLARIDAGVERAARELAAAAGRPHVVRPSPLRTLPIIAVPTAMVVLWLTGALKPVVAVPLGLLFLVPAVWVAVELASHRVVLTGDAIVDVRARSTSRGTAADEPTTVVQKPSGRSGTTRHYPTAIIWRDGDGWHAVSFFLFSNRSKYLIIAAARALVA